MSKDNRLLDKDTVDLLNNVKNKKELSDETREALKAIEKTSQIMDTIISGRQVDLGFYKLFVNASIKKMKRKKSKSSKQ